MYFVSMAVSVATQFHISQLISFISMYLNTEKSVQWESVDSHPNSLSKSSAKLLLVSLS